MKIAVTGHEGLVGSELIKRGYDPLICDITDKKQIKESLDKSNPDVVIHCAALTDVEYCENHPNEAFSVNVRGTSNLIDLLGSKQTIIVLSTDHVFSGEKVWNLGYLETHKPSAINVYGFTKWMSEAVSSFGLARSLVIRTSRLFNYSMLSKDIDLLRTGHELEFTDLLLRSFLHVKHFVDGVQFIAEHIQDINIRPNILHIAGLDLWSYYAFWCQLALAFDIPYELIIPRREKLNNVVPRPFKAGLRSDVASRLGVPLFHISDGIKLMLEEQE